MTQAAPTIEYASPRTEMASRRLVSLDVFRGLVILAMLVVNNLGDGGTTGYFWKHADWVPMPWGQAWRMWWGYARHSTGSQDRADRLPDEIQRVLASAARSGFYPPADHRHFELEEAKAWQQIKALADEQQTSRSPWRRVPLFTHCTLADYVMPWFMLIIGVAIPFSVAASISKELSKRAMWMRALRRGATLVLLGWILCYFRDQFANSLYDRAPWRLAFGLDVLQLLGLSYLVAWTLYGCPAKRRATIAGLLFIGHWALLRFYPQGDVPPGTFNEHFDAIGYIYDHWNTQNLGPLTISFRGLLSVPPAAATMIVGTLIGDLLRGESTRKVKTLVMWGVVMCVIGFVWAFDLPFNKPRWTPSYLLWTSGVGTILLAGLYWVIDVKQLRRWTYPLVVFGTNAIALYFFSILFKVLFLNTPRVRGQPVIEIVLGSLKGSLGPWVGGWTFTFLVVTFWWLVLDQMYRRKVFWRV
jgi:predicted acyltransferase